MGYYYAFCEVHKKCGPKRYDSDSNAEDLAWADCTYHLETVDPPHGRVLVKYSTQRTSRNGNVYRQYKVLESPS